MARGWRLVAVNEQQLTKFATFSTVATARQIVGNSSRYDALLSLLHIPLPLCRKLGQLHRRFMGCAANFAGTKYLICCTGRAEVTTLVRFVLATAQ